jgi:hypothetical protein
MLGTAMGGTNAREFVLSGALNGLGNYTDGWR